MKRIKILLVLLLTSVFVQVSFAQDIIEVEATGIGVSEKAALKDASRNAVLNVAGVLMESSTNIENEEVIEDKIIAVSAGFIESFELMEPVTEISKGYYTAKIKAKVKHKQLATEIANFRESEKSFNMTAVNAVAEEHLSAQEEMGNFLLKAFDDYMKAYNYDVVNCKPLKSEPGSVIVDVRASLSKKDYMSYHNSLVSKLRKLGLKEENTNPYICVGGGRFASSVHFCVDMLKQTQYEKPFKDYVFDTFQKYVYVLRIELKDSNNEVIATKELFPADYMESNPNWDYIVVGATDLELSKDGQRREETKSIKVDLYSAESVKSIAKVTAKIVKVDASQAPKEHPAHWRDYRTL